jgi:hypothetical protein
MLTWKRPHLVDKTFVPVLNIEEYPWVSLDENEFDPARRAAINLSKMAMTTTW